MSARRDIEGINAFVYELARKEQSGWIYEDWANKHHYVIKLGRIKRLEVWLPIRKHVNVPALGLRAWRHYTSKTNFTIDVYIASRTLKIKLTERMATG